MYHRPRGDIVAIWDMPNMDPGPISSRRGFEVARERDVFRATIALSGTEMRAI
jgi:hypothetical protein